MIIVGQNGNIYNTYAIGILEVTKEVKRPCTIEPEYKWNIIAQYAGNQYIIATYNKEEDARKIFKDLKEYVINCYEVFDVNKQSILPTH